MAGRLVRGGFGIFYDEILPKYYFFSGSLNPPFTTRTSIQNPPFPNVVANFNPNAPIRAQLQTVNYDLQTPYIMQFNANVQRMLPGDWDVMMGYVGSRGKNLLRLGDANLAPEEIVNGVKVYRGTQRRNPNFAGIWQRMTDAESFYDSLQLGVHKRLSHGWRAQLSYTLSESTDDSSGINSQDFGNVVQYGLDWYDPEYDRGLSAFHAKHNLTFNATWEIPFFRDKTGVAGALLKGWMLNNITTLRSGHPFTVQLGFNRSGNLNTTSFSMHERPDVVANCDPDSRRTESVLGHQLLQPASGRPARQCEAQFDHRTGPRLGRCVSREIVQHRRPDGSSSEQNASTCSIARISLSRPAERRLRAPTPTDRR